MASPAKVPQFRTPPDANGVMEFNFHPGQCKAWESTRRFVVMMAGHQSGKTVFGPVWLYREMQTKGAGDYMAVTSNYEILDSKMLPALQELFVQDLQKFAYKPSVKRFESFEQEGGHPKYRILVRSAMSPESLESATAQAAWCDEVGQHSFERQSWEAVGRRLSISRGRILATTTPYEIGWFKTEVYDRWLADPINSDIEMVQVDSIENPAFSREEYERGQKLLPRWKFNMFYRGVFEKPAGLIYDAFDETTQVIPRFIIPKEWTHYVGHDFGPQNMAALWLAIDPVTGYAYVHREYLSGGLSCLDHATKFKRMSVGEDIRKRVGGSNTEDGWRESFGAAGWPISKPREKDVELGINAAYALMQQNKLFVFSDVVGFLDELYSYARELDDNYEPTEKINNKSAYHRLDCLRYVCVDFDPERVQPYQKVVPASYHNNPMMEALTRQQRMRRLVGVRR